MKYILYMLCLLGISMPAFSQISRGTCTIGGGFSLSYDETKHPNGNKNKQTSFDLQPDYGIFVLDNLCVGASIGATLRRSKAGEKVNGQELNNKERSLRVGPFVRYYLPINPKLYAFAHAGYAVQWSKFEGEYYLFSEEGEFGIFSLTTQYTTKTWNIGAGLSYFVSPNTALEGMVNYSHYEFKNPDLSDGIFSTGFSEKTGTLTLSIGLRIFLRKSN